MVIVNSAAMPLGCMHVFESEFSSSDIYPEVELLNHAVILVLVFLWKCHTVLHSSCILVPLFFIYQNIISSQYLVSAAH